MAFWTTKGSYDAFTRGGRWGEAAPWCSRPLCGRTCRKHRRPVRYISRRLCGARAKETHLVDAALVGDDKVGLGPAGDDEVTEVPVVGLDVALASAEVETLLEELAKGDEQLALLGLRVWSSVVAGDVETDYTKTAGRAGDHDDLVEDNVRLLGGSAAVKGLVADGVDGAVDHAAVHLDDLLNGVRSLEVDGDAANLLRDGETLWDGVDDVDTAGTADGGGVGGHQTDGAGAEDGNGLAGLEAGEDDAVPAGGEDVGKEGEGGFILGGTEISRELGQSVAVDLLRCREEGRGS